MAIRAVHIPGLLLSSMLRALILSTRRISDAAKSLYLNARMVKILRASITQIYAFIIFYRQSEQNILLAHAVSHSRIELPEKVAYFCTPAPSPSSHKLLNFENFRKIFDFLRHNRLETSRMPEWKKK